MIQVKPAPLREGDEVLLLRQGVIVVEAAHDNVFSFVRIDVVHTRVVIVHFIVARKIWLLSGASLPCSSFAQYTCTIDMRQGAFARFMVGTEAVVSIVWTLENMSLRAAFSIIAITERGECATHGSR